MSKDLLAVTIRKDQVNFVLGEEELIIRGDDWRVVMREVYASCSQVEWLKRFSMAAMMVTDILSAKNGDAEPELFSWTRDALDKDEITVAFDEAGTMYKRD